MESRFPNGIHYLIEFFGCNFKQIDSVEFWKKVLPESIEGTPIEILHSHFHKFEPQGITGFLLLSSSHISVHTWPDKGYAACDIFTCADEETTNIVYGRLKKAISHDHINLEKINRGYQFLSLPIFSNGKFMKLEIKDVLHESQSDFQKIIIADTEEYGKCLIIDEIPQTAEKDHNLYDKEILKPLRKKDAQVLILGGGDGYVAQMALEKYPNLKIDVIDLDVEVVKCAQKYLDQKIFDNKNASLFIGDALHFLKSTEKVYDGIICDLTDTPIGTKKEAENFKNFFEKIIPLSKNKLKDGGWMSVQSGASRTAEGFIDEASIIRSVLEKNLSGISRSDIFIPSFGESCAFLYGKK